MSVNWDYLQKTLFVLPVNDGESARAYQILTSLPAPHVHRSTQRWGAILEKEMTSLQRRLTSTIKTICIFEIPGRETNARGEIKCEQELIESGCHLDIIDHHFYSWVDRRHHLSSLEQLCAKINWQMSAWDYHIAVNDRSYIPGLLDLGLPLSQVREVRKFDLIAQGWDESTIIKSVTKANKCIDSGRMRKVSDLFLLEDTGISPVIMTQELALRYEGGMVNVFEYRGKKLGFSGKPEVVDLLLGQDFPALGLPSPWLAYSGGDDRFTKFFGLKTKKTIDERCRSRVFNLVLTTLDAS